MKLSRSDLTVNELLILNGALRDHEKSLALGYLMLIGGHLGVHRFYVKKITTGIIQLILFILALISYVVLLISLELVETTESGFAWMLGSLVPLLLFGGALTVWVIVDLFLLPGMIRNWNARVEEDILREIYQHRLNTQTTEGPESGSTPAPQSPL